MIAALIVAVLASAAAPAGSEATADSRDPAIRMFDNFFLSLVAARLCDNPDERTLGMFTKNLLIVQEATIGYYKTHLPDRSRDDIFEIMNNRAMALDQGIKATIAEKGCAHSDVINLVNLFDIHAHMDLAGKGTPQ